MSLPSSVRICWLPLLIGLCLISLLASSGSTAYAAADQPLPGDLLWSDVGEANIVAQGKREIVPIQYRSLRLDINALQVQLQHAPLEGSPAAQSAAFLFSLPFPDGTFARFRLVEAPIMDPALASQFPTIQTYAGQGIDDPTATVRLDWTPAGLHAMILSATDTIFIDPYQRGDTVHYISYAKRDFQRPAAKIFVEPLLGNEDAAIASEIAALVASGVLRPSGAQLRTYRLAVAATGEYTQFHGGTVAAGLAAIVTTMNRVNAIYEREVAVRMLLVANNAQIIYTNPITDPYTNDDAAALLDQNQATIDLVIGNANYDIGHVFSTDGGGAAVPGVPCHAGLKALGETGSPAPVGDPFDVDYVAHEIGHQFGANHTFNGTVGSCVGGNRNGPTAYEPGSGSTIMAYAGICGVQNLQPNSDAYFHSASFDEIVAYTTLGFGNSCAVTTNTANVAPVPDAGSSYTIPRQTPFTLTGSATDANNDGLTYNWEEFDLGAAGAPNNPTNPPFFRSFPPTISPTRTFPQWPNIINNTTTIGEILPNTTRVMTFRLTVRDNRLGGGGVNYANTTVRVTAAGPFLVTAPNTALSWNGGSTQNVTWNVANTNVAPINCATVNLLLSTDGGFTYPTGLATGVPNNGSASVIVPNIATTTARIQVVCAGNIFFDISNENFTIVPDNSVPTVVNVTASTANGTYKIGDVIDIKALFSKNVLVSGTPQLRLETGATDAVIDYLGGSGSNRLTFRYTVAAGQISADLDYSSTSALLLNGGRIQDSVGNNAILTLPAPGTAGSLGANQTIMIDGVAPDTIITASPPLSTSMAVAGFGFTGEDGGSGAASFECQLDNSGFNACTTPLTLNSLSDGEHSFQVRALDAAGNQDPTPAVLRWTVDTSAPDTALIRTPLTLTTITTASFAYSGNDGSGVGVASFVCSLDSAPFAACAANITHRNLADGHHTFAVRALDRLGNVDPTPASFIWTVDTTAPTVTFDSVNGQADPTNISPIHFTVIFAEPVTGFGDNPNDVVISGTASRGTIATVTENAPVDGTTYDVAVRGMAMDGTVMISVVAGAAIDGAGHGNAPSIATSDSVRFDFTEALPVIFLPMIIR